MSYYILTAINVSTGTVEYLAGDDELGNVLWEERQFKCSNEYEFWQYTVTTLPNDSPELITETMEGLAA